MLTLLATAQFMTGCEPSTPPSPPPSTVDNLVLICIDTVGADNFFNPNIDDPLALRLGSAQKYLNANSVAPWTIPAVASTLTGLYPVQHNAGQFESPVANLDVDLPRALSDSAQTLAEMLNEQQFRTGAVSAHPWFTAGFGLEQGFKQLHARKGSKKITTKFKQWLDESLKQKNQKRFFGYLHFMEAHDWHLRKKPERDARMAEIDPALRIELLKEANDEACGADESSDHCQRNLIYNLAVRELRDAINTVLEGLEERDLLKNTLVVVYSDHGEEFWEHKAQHELRDDPRKVRGFGHGHSMFEELLHVPLVAWHPNFGGADHEQLVSLVDVTPSVLAWLGLEQPGHALPGMALPAGAQKPVANNEPRILFASGIAYGSNAIAVREGQLKSIMHYPDENFQFFDLSLDPGEHQPLQDDSLMFNFDALTGDYIEMKNESLASGSGPEMDAQTLEHLKSIGYLQGVEEQPEPEQADKSAPDPSGQREAESSQTDDEETPQS